VQKKFVKIVSFSKNKYAHKKVIQIEVCTNPWTSLKKNNKAEVASTHLRSFSPWIGQDRPWGFES
jgi:hypothetical protein